MYKAYPCHELLRTKPFMLAVLLCNSVHMEPGVRAPGWGDARSVWCWLTGD